MHRIAYDACRRGPQEERTPATSRKAVRSIAAALLTAGGSQKVRQAHDSSGSCVNRMNDRHGSLGPRADEMSGRTSMNVHAPGMHVNLQDAHAPGMCTEYNLDVCAADPLSTFV